MKSPVRCPEADKRDSCLHENALENVAMYMMAQFVRQHRFNLIGCVVIQKRVRQNNSPSAAKSGESRIRLLAFLRKPPAVHAANPRAGVFAENHQSPAQFFILKRLEFIKDRKQHNRGQLREENE